MDFVPGCLVRKTELVDLYLADYLNEKLFRKKYQRVEIEKMNLVRKSKAIVDFQKNNPANLQLIGSLINGLANIHKYKVTQSYNEVNNLLTEMDDKRQKKADTAECDLSPIDICESDKSLQIQKNPIEQLFREVDPDWGKMVTMDDDNFILSNPRINNNGYFGDEEILQMEENERANITVWSEKMDLTPPLESRVTMGDLTIENNRMEDRVEPAQNQLTPTKKRTTTHKSPNKTPSPKKKHLFDVEMRSPQSRRTRPSEHIIPVLPMLVETLPENEVPATTEIIPEARDHDIVASLKAVVPVEKDVSVEPENVEFVPPMTPKPRIEKLNERKSIKQKNLICLFSDAEKLARSFKNIPDIGLSVQPKPLMDDILMAHCLSADLVGYLKKRTAGRPKLAHSRREIAVDDDIQVPPEIRVSNIPQPQETMESYEIEREHSMGIQPAVQRSPQITTIIEEPPIPANITENFETMNLADDLAQNLEMDRENGAAEAAQPVDELHESPQEPINGGITGRIARLSLESAQDQELPQENQATEKERIQALLLKLEKEWEEGLIPTFEGIYPLQTTSESEAVPGAQSLTTLHKEDFVQVKQPQLYDTVYIYQGSSFQRDFH